MKKNILIRTNFLVCLIIIIGFLMTAFLSYQMNYTASLDNIEQVSSLTSEGIYYQYLADHGQRQSASLDAVAGTRKS